MEKRTIRVGVDVGGTNTDICAIDEKTGELMVYKLPSSLHDQSVAVVEGVQVIAKEYGFEGDFVTEYNYGELPAKVEKNEYSYEVFVKDDVSKEWESIGIIDRDEKIDADIDKMLYAYVSKYNGWSKVIRDEKIVDEKVRYVYYLDVYYKD